MQPFCFLITFLLYTTPPTCQDLWVTKKNTWKKRYFIQILFIGIFYVVGIVGMYFPTYRSFFVNLSFFLLVSSIPAFVGKVIFTETKAAMLTNVLLCLCYNLFFYYKMYYYLLRNVIEKKNGHTFEIFLDVKYTRSSLKVKKLR